MAHSEDFSNRLFEINFFGISPVRKVFKYNVLYKK
jgi:hypothetical protein